MQVSTIREVDLEIVGALQANPRASWAEIGRAVGTSATTVARRWARLSADGLAWATAHPGRRFLDWGIFALVSVRCTPGSTMDVGYALSLDPRAISVEVMTGAADIEVTVATAFWEDYAAYVLETIPTIPGVRDIETTVSTEIHRLGSGWRTGALAPGKDAQLARSTPPRDLPKMDAMDLTLCNLLGEDARRSVEALAQELEISNSNVRRRIQRLVSNEVLALRCDVAASRWGWPVQARLRGTLWSVPAPTPLPMEGLSELRLAVSVAGRYNLHTTAWLRRVGDLPAFEQRVQSSWPGFNIMERSLVVRPLKRMGTLLSPEGRRADYQRLAAWYDSAAD